MTQIIKSDRPGTDPPVYHQSVVMDNHIVVYTWCTAAARKGASSELDGIRAIFLKRVF